MNLFEGIVYYKPYRVLVLLSDINQYNILTCFCQFRNRLFVFFHKYIFSGISISQSHGLYIYHISYFHLFYLHQNLICYIQNWYISIFHIFQLHDVGHLSL